MCKFPFVFLDEETVKKRLNALFPKASQSLALDTIFPVVYDRLQKKKKCPFVPRLCDIKSSVVNETSLGLSLLRAPSVEKKKSNRKSSNKGKNKIAE